MREIKFRAWNKETKKMIDPHKLTPLALHKDCAEMKGVFLPFHKDLELIEYTGLKDKNGKEIYEGDILQIFDKNHEVKIINTESKCFVDYGYPDKHNGPTPYWVEIIGNIYENPKLLES